uniref:Uncharacterized protein n=1 Tax=Rhizophora mucronata TaxID=61149 RepID=A0A2P2Q163_RHIMU
MAHFQLYGAYRTHMMLEPNTYRIQPSYTSKFTHFIPTHLHHPEDGNASLTAAAADK